MDNLLYLKWQEAVRDLKSHRDPLEASFFKEQAEIDAKALELYKKSPKKALKYLTQYTNTRMEQTVDMYRKLRKLLISKYTNNKQRL